MPKSQRYIPLIGVVNTELARHYAGVSNWVAVRFCFVPCVILGLGEGLSDFFRRGYSGMFRMVPSLNSMQALLRKL